MTTMPITSSSDAGIILFDAARQRYYNLDALAAMVWSLMRRPITLLEMRDAVVEQFDLEPEAAERHIVDLLDEMETNGLIEQAAS
ncbi:MAG: PqqD family protein [Anaerolineae bacterium]|nr:PqqD family protein [Anaerolineae bacterium]